jgi:parallel beta-helix repeat protein
VFVLAVRPATAQAGTVYIMPDGSISPSGQNITSRDNITYTFTGDIYGELVVERDNIVVDGGGHTLQGAESESGVTLSGRTNVTIENMEIKSSSEGIFLTNCSNNYLLGNTVTDSPNGYGILVGSSSNTTISGNNIKLSANPMPGPGASGICILLSSTYTDISKNTIEDTFEGIQLQDSSLNTVSGNILLNDYYGMGIVESNNNTISENTVTSGLNGVDFERCTNNILSGNNVTENNDEGVILYPQASSNVLNDNIVANNNIGIVLWEASNNLIYANSFVNNSQQVRIFESGYSNSWDNGYPSGGNFWSDYNGTDFYSGPYQNVSGSDGIGDTPYVIDSANIDNYPLVPLEKTLNLMVTEYQGLLSNYTALQSKQEATTNDLNNTRNLMYIFLTAMAIFVVATIYLMMRKRKSQGEPTAGQHSPPGE